MVAALTISVLAAAPGAQAVPVAAEGQHATSAGAALASPPTFAPGGRTAATRARAAHIVQPTPRYGFKAPPPGTPRSGVRATAEQVFWAGARQSQDGESDGLFGYMTVGRPILDPADFHSLGELAAQSSNLRNIVEVGWTVDRGLFGDDFPHLFVFHWVNGSPTCYNGCGWRQWSSNVRPGQVLTTGSRPRFDIFQWQGNWWIGVDSEWIGYFPGSLWSGEYTQAFLAQWFGEVFAAGPMPCSDMGNGLGPNSRYATAVTGLGLNNGPDLTLVKVAFNPELYNSRILSATSVRFGGPGAC
jgi:hypothetical protein